MLCVNHIYMDDFLMKQRYNYKHNIFRIYLFIYLFIYFSVIYTKYL